MRMIIHGIKSLIRRPAKTIMLFMILFVVFNLIFTGFIIENSIKESKDYIRNQIGGAVEYRMDYAAAEAEGDDIRPPSLSLQVAEKIAINQYVRNYFITESANVNSDKIVPAGTQQTGGGFQRDFSNFILTGSNNTEHLDFVIGNVKLAEGNTLSEDDLNNGNKVVLISQDVAKTNNLRIGDTVSLVQAIQKKGGPNEQNNTDSTSTATAVDYEVTGIYEVLKDSFNINTMFTSNTVISEINGTTASDDTNASIVYLLDSPNHVEAFKKEASPYLTSEYHVLYSNDDEYNSLTKPLNLISFITSILIWVVFIAGAAIILAIVTIFVRDRKFEIGLLLSSGEGKIKINSQFIFEMLVIAIIAFAISVASSNLTSKSVSNWIVENQLLSQTSLIGSTSTTTTDDSKARNPGKETVYVSVYGEVDMQNVADEFDVALSASVIGKLLLASIILVLIGSSIPLILIMGYNPKRILQDY